MIRLWAVRMLAGGLALLGGGASANDPFFPQHGNSGYDVKHYDITLDATDRTDLVGRAELRIKAKTRLDMFELDLEHLQVTSVTVDGREANFRQTRNKLKIRPRRAIRRDERFKVVVRYHGNPKPLPDPTTPHDPHMLPLGWIKYGDTSYVVSEPIGASSFYPCNDEPSDKAGFAFHITVDKPFVAVANGVFEGRDDLGSTHRFNWRQRQPMTTWLATVQINDRYTLTRQRAGDIPLRYYTTPKTSDEELAAFLETPKMIAFFESIAGPYPFDSYGSVVVDDPKLLYPLETQSMSTFAQDVITIPLVAHELAHQWFGNSVTPRQWKDIWLAEGFAQYLQILYPRRDRPAAFDAHMRALYGYVKRNEVGPVVVSRPEDLFEDSTYNRGAVVLYALRRHVGERTFNDILRTWCRTYRNKTVDTQDFIDLAVETSGDASVADLLQAWIYAPVVPALPGGDALPDEDIEAALEAGAVDNPGGRRRPSR